MNTQISEKKIVLVTGATGGQGGSVARHLQQRGDVVVRCLTRNPSSSAAEQLRGAGAEVVGGDLADTDSLRAALQGVQYVFGLTNYWEHFDAEYQQGRNLVDAIAETPGIERFLFSTLPSAKALSNGELEVPHLEGKALLEQYTRERGLPAAFCHVAFYYENFFTFFPPRAQPYGMFAFGFPQGDTPLAAVSVEDAGSVIANYLMQPDAPFQGEQIGVVGDHLPCAEYAAAITEVVGKRVLYRHIPRETFAALGFPGAEDLANMFDLNRRFIPNRTAELEQSKALYPSLRSFATWMAQNKRTMEMVLSK
jgi:uncharacterized protein YbjT (DUF2867 family)